MILKLKLQSYGHLSQLIGKDPDAREDWGKDEKGVTEDEVVGLHLWLNVHEKEQTPGDSKGHNSLVCCSSWSCKESDDLATEQQQWPDIGKVGEKVWGRN